MADEQNPELPITLSLSWTDYASANLNARIKQLRKIDQRLELDGRLEAIQFLRGVSSRASFVLPAFYAHLGSRIPLETPDAPYWKHVQVANIEHASLVTLSLSCRCIFDDSRKGMTGKRFAEISDPTLLSVAQYWAECAELPIEDAAAALELLREVFHRCAKPRKVLLDAPSLLERRVGLLKYHADRQAAHISLEPFNFHLIDVIHVVAAVTVIGAIIISFDGPTRGSKYFDTIDEGGWEAAKAMFPTLPGDRLFQRFAIHDQARNYWSVKQFDGLNMILNQLPSAIGYWDSRNEADDSQNEVGASRGAVT